MILSNSSIGPFYHKQQERYVVIKKVLYTDFEGMDSIIAQMMGSKEMKKALTRTNLYKFWAKVAGKKLSDHSKPYGMAPNGVMIVACENTIVVQELQLMKFQIITELQPYLKSLNMHVKDLRFDCKKWVKTIEE